MEITFDQAHATWVITANGELYWKRTCGARAKEGTRAGHLQDTGYWRIRYKGTLYLLHRIVFLMTNGYMPRAVDHADGNTKNNHPLNLRPATVNQNNHNAKRRVDNTSGIKGVSFDKRNGMWAAQCMVNTKQHWLGYHATKALAGKAVQKFREAAHGVYHNHG